MEISLLKERVCPVFRTFLTFVCSQWSLAQNNPYAKEAYFEMVYSGTCHTINISTFYYFLVDYMQNIYVQWQSKKSSLRFKYYSWARRKGKGISQKLMSLASKPCQCFPVLPFPRVPSCKTLKINIQIKPHYFVSARDLSDTVQVREVFIEKCYFQPNLRRKF